MPNPFDVIDDLETEEKTTTPTMANPFDEIEKNPFEAIREPILEPTLPNYLRFKLSVDKAHSERSKYLNEAMWGRMDNQEALKKGNEARNYWMTQAGPYEDLSFKKHPFKYVAGETAQLLPYMISSQVEGLKYGLTLGGGFAAITAVAGQAPPLTFLPEEVATVPTAFASGMATGYSYGVIKNILDREGGGLYGDMLEKGISPETGRSLALAGGALIGVIELMQFKLLGKPFKQAFSKVVKSNLGKKAITQAMGRYLKTVGGEMLEEELQEVTSLVTETIAGAIDEKPDAMPTREEWQARLLETAARAGAGLAVISVPGAAVDISTSMRLEKIVKKKEDIDLLNKIISELKGEEVKEKKLEAPTPEILPLAIRLKSGEVITDPTAKLHSDIIANKGINPEDVQDVGITNKEGEYQAIKAPDEKGGAPLKGLQEVPKELLDKARELIQKKPKITPEKLKPDISGIAPLQRQIQAMEDRQARVEIAQGALEEINTVREYFKGRITKYEKEYLKEELTGIPKYYITKEGGIKPDEAIDELRTNFNIEISDEVELKQYLQNLEQSKKELIAEIKANKPELITKRETTLLNERIKATEQGLKEGRIQTKEEIEKTQIEIIQMIEDAKLPLDERAKFLRAVKNIQTKEDLARELPKIAERLRGMKEKQIREELTSEIKKIAEQAKTSNVIAVEYANLIRDVVNQFELQGHRPETIETLQKTKDFIMRQIEAGKEVEMPKEVLDKLEILQRKPFKKITNEELEELRDSIEELERLGRTKLRLRQMAYERRKAQDLAKIKESSKPIQSKDLIRKNIGEKLSTTETLKNYFTRKFNKLTEKKIVLTPMDAVIDELDGNKNYEGNNFAIFKKTIDKDFGDYFNLREDFTKKVIELAKDLDESNFERIAAYATLQQEGGLEKLEVLGYTQEDVEKITLTDKESALLEAMRVEFDKSWPQISETMRIVYNQPLEKVAFYFPFMTDFDAMTDFEIRDKFLNTPQYSKILKKNPEMGFTKQRMGGKQKINLNAMEVFLRHMDDVSYLLSVGKDIKYLNDLAATEEYGQAVGDVGQEIMREWLDLIARKGRLAGDRVAILDMLRRYTAGAYLSFKLSSALVQFTALFDGAALIGNYAFEGTQMITNKPIRTFLKNNFPELKQRIGDDPAYMEFFENDTFVDKAIRGGLYVLRTFDLLTASSVTIGAYKKYCIENGIDFDIEKPNKDAIEYAQLILRRTQSSAAFKDIPLALSKGKLTGHISVDKLILQFQTFLLNRWSLITHDLYKAGIKGVNKKQALNIAIWLSVATMAEFGMRRIIRQAISTLKGEEDEKEAVTDFLGNSLNNIPFVGNLISIFYYGSIGIPSIDLINRIAEYSSAGFKSKTEEAKIRNFIKALVLGIPGGAQLIELMPKTKKDGGLEPI